MKIADAQHGYAKRLLIKTYTNYDLKLSQELYSWDSWKINTYLSFKTFNSKELQELHNGTTCFNYLAFLKDKPTQLIGQYKIINGRSFLVINPQFMNQGYATEMVSYIIQKINLNTIQAFINANNIASQKVFLKCNFILKIKTKNTHVYEYKK